MKKTALIITLFMIMQLIPIECFKVYANEQAIPTNLSVAQINGQPVIAYTPEKGNYARLTWDEPTSWGGDEQNYELHYRAEDETVYQLYGGAINKTETEIELVNLKPGTVYYAHLSAIHEHTLGEGGQPAETHNAESEEIRFMTDTEVIVEPGDESNLNIKWNNVQYEDASVSYDVYISESFSFAETLPIHVESGDIGIGKPVEIIGDYLLYSAKDLKEGTVYYVKIKTTIEDGRVTCLPASAPADGFTYIYTEITRVSSDWWKLQWTAVTNSDLSGGEGTLYKIFRSVDGDLEKEIAGTKDNSILVKVPVNNTYFKVQAEIVSQLGNTLNVISRQIKAEEREVIIAPPVPVILENLSEQHTEIGSDNLKILWEAPYTITNELDTDLSYDIWLLTNQEDIDDEALEPNVENFSPAAEDYVYEMIGNLQGTRVVGYKYELNELEPNSVYYLKMIAKKTYTVDGDEVTVSSEPALKVIVTLPDGAIDQPIVPSVPPFKVKTETIDGNEVQVTTKDSITLEWKNQWHEIWNDTDSKWDYLADEDVEQAKVDGEIYRQINYDPDVMFSVGYEVYTEDFDYSRLLEETSLMPMQIKDIANNTASTTIDYTVTGLQPNTSYIMWARAYRSDSLKSHLSDPVIVSTKAGYDIPLNKPAIPSIDSIFEGDTYVELEWDIKQNHNYIIKYGVEDDVTKASDTINLSPEDLEGKTEYIVNDLIPEMVYFFWIKAKLVGENEEEEESSWSDSYYAKTLPFAPPDVPSGFGLKNIDEPVGKDYIFFEWIEEDGLEYVLEFSKFEDFREKTSHPVKEGSELKIEKLVSNTRYYARLYAYDPDKKLVSNYTSRISVKTLTSNDEYDTGSDIGEPADIPNPEFDREDEDMAVLIVDNDKTDLIIEQIFNDPANDYQINFEELNSDELSQTKHPEGVDSSKTRISPRVFTALKQMRKNLIINNGPAVLIIKPEIMQNQLLNQKVAENPNGTIEILFKKISNPTNKTSGSSYVSSVWDVTIAFETNAGKLNLTALPGLKIKIPYYDTKWFDKLTMSGCIYDTKTQQWTRTLTTNNFDSLYSEGFVYSNINGSGAFAIMKIGGGKYSDISSGSYSTEIKAVTEKYNLKCIGTGLFEPSKTVTKEEAVKILLDILSTNYQDDYLILAKKSGITSNIDLSDVTLQAKKEEAGAMLTRGYELITGNKAASNISLNNYYDRNQVNINLTQKVAFAVENKIIDASGGYIRPKDSFSRGEMMKMIYAMLQKAQIM